MNTEGPKPRTVDTKTRFKNVYARHQLSCALSIGGDRCNCTPKYWGSVWDREAGRHRKTAFFRLATEARDARVDLEEAVRKGKLPRGSKVRLDKTRERFLEAVDDGIALSKRRRPYKPKSARSLKDALDQLPESMLRKAVDRVTRGEVQDLVDDLKGKGLSASRIGGIVNALRSLYHWAHLHELVGKEFPTDEVRLPAKDEKRRTRIVSPPELADLLRAIHRQTLLERKEGKARDKREALRDSVPFALAGYAGARHQEIQVLDWTDVDFADSGLELAADEEGRKPGGSWRIVPMVAPLRVILREEWLAQGRPKKGRVCPPKRKSKSGLLAVNMVQTRVHKRWRDLGLQPVGLHDLRHALATWLDHAGISPKVSSEIMGHMTPEYLTPGAARITQDRYTHMLTGELQRALKQLEAFLEERMNEESTGAGKAR
jgi:integrase